MRRRLLRFDLNFLASYRSHPHSDLEYSMSGRYDLRPRRGRQAGGGQQPVLCNTTKVPADSIARGPARIVHLPGEVLAEVLLIYVAAWQAIWGPHRQQWGWLRIAHVCRYWRQVVLSLPLRITAQLGQITDPTLWFINNSRALLHVEGRLDFSLQQAGAYENWAPIHRASHRVQSLGLRVFTDESFYPLGDYNMPPFSRLKKLDIELVAEPDLAPVEHLPSFLCSDDISLDRFSTCGFPFAPVQRFLKPSLRRLSLKKFSARDVPWDLLLHTLENLSDLEELTLADSFTSLPRGFRYIPLVIGRQAILPHLRFLNVVGEVAAGAGFVSSQISFPRSSPLLLAYGGEFLFNEDQSPTRSLNPNDAGDLQCLAAAVSYRLSGEPGIPSTSTPILALRIDLRGVPSRGDNHLRVVGWSSTASPDSLPHAEDAAVVITGGYSILKLLCHLHAYDCLNHLQFLDLTDCEYLMENSANDLRAAFGSLRTLATIRAERSTVLAVLSAMRPAVDVPFAALRTLHVHDFDFVSSSDWGMCDEENLVTCETVLRTRAARGYRLPELRIDNANYGRWGAKARLECCVGKVIWGHSVVYSDDDWYS